MGIFKSKKELKTLIYYNGGYIDNTLCIYHTRKNGN